MNWILGLKRLWVLASIAATAVICNEGRGLAEHRCRDYWPHSPLPDCGSAVWRTIFEGAALSIAVSVAMYIVGAGIIWVVRGFRQKVPQA